MSHLSQGQLTTDIPSEKHKVGSKVQVENLQKQTWFLSHMIQPGLTNGSYQKSGNKVVISLYRAANQIQNLPLPYHPSYSKRRTYCLFLYPCKLAEIKVHVLSHVCNHSIQVKRSRPGVRSSAPARAVRCDLISEIQHVKPERDRVSTFKTLPQNKY